jgi:Icc-related predicted phosphoesterase
MLDADTVVVTHHAPSARSVNPKYEGDYLNPAFASEILGADGVDAPLWIHGHMHDAVDYTVGKTRVVCNPRGYPGEVYRTGEYQFKVVDI